MNKCLKIALAISFGIYALAMISASHRMTKFHKELIEEIQINRKETQKNQEMGQKILEAQTRPTGVQ